MLGALIFLELFMSAFIALLKYSGAEELASVSYWHIPWLTLLMIWALIAVGLVIAAFEDLICRLKNKLR